MPIDPLTLGLGAALSIGGGLIGSSAQASAQRAQAKRQQDVLNALNNGEFGSLRDVFGTVPGAASYEPVSYTPVDYGQVQLDTIAGNKAAMPSITDLNSMINDAVMKSDQLRIETLAPGFGRSLTNLASAANDLTAGRLPMSDVLKVVNDRQSLSDTLGTPGTSTSATLKDLGLTQLGAIQQGADMMGKITALAESINPVSSISTPQQFMLYPAQTVPWKIGENEFASQFQSEQNQLLQQSEQNANNLAAMPNPQAAGLFGANFMAAMGAPMQTSPFSGLGTGVSAIGSGLFAAGLSGGFGQTPGAGINPYASSLFQGGYAMPGSGATITGAQFSNSGQMVPIYKPALA